MVALPAEEEINPTPKPDSNIKTDDITYHKEGIKRFISHIMESFLSRPESAPNLVGSSVEEGRSEWLWCLLRLGVGPQVPCLGAGVCVV